MKTAKLLVVALSAVLLLAGCCGSSGCYTASTCCGDNYSFSASTSFATNCCNAGYW